MPVSSLLCSQMPPNRSELLKLNNKRERGSPGALASGLSARAVRLPRLQYQQSYGQGNSPVKAWKSGREMTSCEATEFSCPGLSGTRLSQGPTQAGSSGGGRDGARSQWSWAPWPCPICAPGGSHGEGAWDTISFLATGRGSCQAATALSKHISETGDDASSLNTPGHLENLIMKCTCRKTSDDPLMAHRTTSGLTNILHSFAASNNPRVPLCAKP